MLGGDSDKWLLETMSILLQYPPRLKAYNLEIVTAELEVDCPCCGKNMRKHEYSERLIVWKHRIQTITILRMRCPRCDITHSLIPSFLIPWGRFANHIREFFIRLMLAGIPLTHLAERLTTWCSSILSLRTLRRWKQRLKAKGLLWLQATREKALSIPVWEGTLLHLHRWQGDLAEEAQLLIVLTLGEQGHSMPRSGRWLDALNLYLPPPGYW